MNHSQTAYTQRILIAMCGILVLIVFVCIPYSVLYAETDVVVSTETEEDIQAKIDEQNIAIADIQAEIEKYQKQLNAASGQSASLKNLIHQLTLTEKKLNASVRSMEAKIRSTTSTIQKLSREIGTTTSDIKVQREALKETFRSIRESDDESLFTIFFTKNKATDISNELHQFEELHSTLGEKTSTLLSAKNSLISKKSETENEAQKLARLKKGIENEKRAVVDTKSQKASVLSATQKQEKVYRDIIAEKIRLKEQYEADLTAYESQLGFTLDPNRIPKQGSRVLSWPLEYVYITQPFGFTSSSAKLYGYRSGSYKGKHAGVDFRANNDKVYAMSNGVVADSGDTDKVCKHASLGRWILIKYDNGLSSIYGHLSKIVASDGERVDSETVVAYSGNTGYSTAPHLHIGVAPADAVTVETWPSKSCVGKDFTTPIVAGSTYFDPLDYLPVATDDMFKPGSYATD